MPLVNPKALQGHAVGEVGQLLSLYLHPSWPAPSVLYGTQGQAMSPEMRETYLRRLGNELGWSATVAQLRTLTITASGTKKVVTDVLTVLASDDPSNPEHYSRMKPYKVLDIIFEVKTLAWWDDVTDISVHAFDAFTHDRVTTIDWEDALTFTERLRVGANKSELMAQAKTIAENLLELIRERIDHVKARMTVLADRLEQQSGGAIHSSANALVMGLPTRSFPQSPSPPLSMPPLLARWARVGSRSIDQPPGRASTDTPSMQG
ncbi:hypothetical protein FA13DRAFT_1721636 [Coprinellus micaceus]|uniref:Uncharacterized protein n=1 Tax=Coprinellus micaceus TaxID=71717 RepID=A0A4Y7RZC9_COPMI|nr:hypothetical protein FA13DRAFT_1721636 [Coprinellus micaceus]